MIQLSKEQMARSALRSIEEMTVDTMRGEPKKLEQLIETVAAYQAEPELLAQAWALIMVKLTPSEAMVVDSVDHDLRYLVLSRTMPLDTALLVQSTRHLNRIMYGGVSVGAHITGVNVPQPPAAGGTQDVQKNDGAPSGSSPENTGK